MQYSKNLNMNKPERADQYNLDHWNDNTDILDSAIQNIKTLNDATLKTALLNFCYPVGSLYWSSQATDPSTLFGGTWVQIKDRFVWAKGDSDTINNTGGAKTVTLTSNEIPSHNHTFTGTAHNHTFTGSEVTSGGSSASNTGSESSHTHSVTASGSISGGAYSFSGSAVTSGANNRGHTHTLNDGNTSSSGTTKTAGFRGVSVTSGAMSGNSTGGFRVYDYDIPVEGNITLDKKSATSAQAQILDGTTSNANYWLKNNIAHTHNVTANGYLYGKTDGESQNHTHSVTASGTISITTNPTFSGSAVTSGSGSSHKHSMAHTHSVTASGSIGNTTASGTIGNTGGGQAHENMPPYIVKYCWERTA